MKVSVVLCTYSDDLFDDFIEAAESVLNQTYENIELIIVVDGNDRVCEMVKGEYGENDTVRIFCSDTNQGLSASRNIAIDKATGDVMAFIDDDAIADPSWIEELVGVYDSNEDAIAAGGRMAPEWVAGKPSFLPEEYYWLVGVTHRGFAEAGEEVRNTFGSNISFRTDVLRELGGFEPSVGRQGEKNLQKHETEFCARMRRDYGRGVIYNPDAVVYHKVFEYRTRKRWLAERAFWQGYSNRAMEVIVPEDATTAEESAYLRKLLFEFFPQRVINTLKRPSYANAQRLLALILLTGLVGIGYIYGLVKW